MAQRGRHLAPTIRRISRTWVLPLTLVMSLVMGGVALADNLNDTLAAGSVSNPTIAVGGSFATTIDYQVQETGGNNTTFPATVSFVLTGAPAWISLDVSSLSFSGYSDVKSITVSGTAPSGSAGTHNFTVTPSTSAVKLNTDPGKVNMSVAVTSPAPPSDTTPPTISYVLNPASPDGANGWYKSNVSLTWTVTEAESASSLVKTGCVDQNITTDQAATTYSCSATSDGGSAAQVDVTIKRDGTVPTVAYTSASPAANSDGWHNTDVTATFTATDNLSGFGSLSALTTTGTSTTSGEGTSVMVGSPAFTDNAGNSAAAGTATSDGFKIDKTAPVVSVTGVSDGATYTLGSVPTAGCSTTETLSGVKTATSLSSSGGPVGSFTATCSAATDNADNTGSPASVTYTVIFDFAGFFRPVDNLPALNVAKAGSAIPLKFSLGGNQGLNIFAVGSPTSKVSSCDVAGDPDVIEETVTAGQSSLSYDSIVDQYVYVWKTDKGWAGTCRTLTVKLADGTIHQALFKLTK